MNGLGYGRYSGLSGSSHSMKEYANSYNGRGSSNYGYLLDVSPRQHAHGQSSMSRFEDAMYNAIPVKTPNGLRPYSAGSQIPNMNNRPTKKFRSHGNFNHPLTKQVDQLLYEIPDFKFTKNALCQAPEFLKVFSDVRCTDGEKAVFDCVLLGSPRPKVHWLFNDGKMTFDDVLLEDTADVCRCTIKNVQPYHYGVYTVLAENEAGRAITTATLLPIGYI